ncbi:hypothetical protein AADZ84_13150 [Colwelliaceae bacterium MEBiC 14330]
MVLNNFINKRVVFELLAVLLITLMFVSVTNSYNVKSTIKDNEYSNEYNTKFQKGYLTAEEVSDLKKMEKEHINDEKLRSQRFSGYFSILALGMITYSVLIYLLRRKVVIKHNIISSFIIVGFASLAVTGSVWQCLFWMLFFGIGMKSKNKIIKDSRS